MLILFKVPLGSDHAIISSEWRCLTVQRCKKIKNHMLTPSVPRSSSISLLSSLSLPSFLLPPVEFYIKSQILFNLKHFWILKDFAYEIDIWGRSKGGVNKVLESVSVRANTSFNCSTHCFRLNLFISEDVLLEQNWGGRLISQILFSQRQKLVEKQH